MRKILSLFGILAIGTIFTMSMAQTSPSNAPGRTIVTNDQGPCTPGVPCNATKTPLQTNDNANSQYWRLSLQGTNNICTDLNGNTCTPTPTGSPTGTPTSTPTPSNSGPQYACQQFVIQVTPGASIPITLLRIYQNHQVSWTSVGLGGSGTTNAVTVFGANPPTTSGQNFSLATLNTGSLITTLNKPASILTNVFSSSITPTPGAAVTLNFTEWN